MAQKQMDAVTKRAQAVLEDASERSRALSRMLGWAAEEATLLGHGTEAERIRELSLALASKPLN